MVSHVLSPVESRILGLGYRKPSGRATAPMAGFRANQVIWNSDCRESGCRAAQP
ncbi:hypothetical protein CDS [Bradyrhizobium sp.]|nr:hypothetical protein CDS [Bradyrhizobium sp.]